MSNWMLPMHQSQPGPLRHLGCQTETQTPEWLDHKSKKPVKADSKFHWMVIKTNHRREQLPLEPVPIVRIRLTKLRVESLHRGYEFREDG